MDGAGVSETRGSVDDVVLSETVAATATEGVENVNPLTAKLLDALAVNIHVIKSYQFI